MFVKEVPDPENFGVVVYDDSGRVTDLAEKAGVVDLRYDAPPTSDAVVGLYCYPGRCVRRDREARAVELGVSSRSPMSTGTYAQSGRLAVVRVRGWWEDAGKHWQHLAEIGRRIDETGANK